MLNNSQIFMLLFLMLGPFKILGPFAKITKNASPLLARQIAIRAILYSVAALVLAILLGESMLDRYGIPIPILALSAGIILFIVALLNILNQFQPPVTNQDTMSEPTFEVALKPLAFPVIVTPYGIATVIVFVALSHDLYNKLIVGAMVVGIMLLNLLLMLYAKPIFRPLAAILAILGAILGIVQVALGANIIFNSLKALLHL